MIRSSSDCELAIRFARKRERKAFEELVRRWDRRILGFLHKSCGDREVAEDLRQEVFLRVYRHAATYDPKFAFSTWLFRIAINALASWRTRRSRSAVVGSIEDFSVSEVESIDPSLDPRQRYAESEMESCVREAIEGLPEQERQLLLLRLDLEFSYRKIAEIVKAPETTVKSRIYKTLGRLRHDLQRLEPEERRVGQ